MKKLLQVAVLTASLAFGQVSLTIPAQTAIPAPGTLYWLPLTYTFAGTPNSGTPLADASAVQFNLIYPANMAVWTAVQPGPLSKTAGKQVTCAAVTTGLDPGTKGIACVIAGQNQTTLTNGVNGSGTLAWVPYAVGSSFTTGTMTVSSTMGSTPDGNGEFLNGGSGALTRATVLGATVLKKTSCTKSDSKIKCTVSLKKPAPKGGLVVLISSPAQEPDLPPAVLVVEGQKTVSFEFTPSPTSLESYLEINSGYAYEVVTTVIRR